MDAVKRKKKSLKWDFVKYFLICMILILTGSLLLGISADKLFSPSDYVIFFGEEGIFSIRRNAGEIPERYILLLSIADLVQCIGIPLIFGQWTEMENCGYLLWQHWHRKKVARLPSV